MTVNLGSGLGAEPIIGELVTGNYFQHLGVRAQLGRTLLPSDEIAPGQHPVVVLSDSLWKRSFAGDRDIVGKVIRLNTYPLTVVGVAEPAFHGTIVSFDVEVFVPLMMAPQIGPGAMADRENILSNSQANLLVVMGRLRPGTTRADAAAQITGLSAQLSADAEVGALVQQLAVVPFWRSPFGAQTYLMPAVVVLSAMAALLLAIVCANVTSLVLARGVSRRGEISLRLALGASRSRVVRLLLVEQLVLAVPGALGGVALVPLIMPTLFAVMAEASPFRLFFNLSVDRLVMTFSVLAACASALLFGLLPALNSARVDLLSAIKDDLSPRGPGRARVRMALVVSQVAVSVLLLVGARLVSRSLDATRQADPGYDGSDVVVMRIDATSTQYDAVRGRALFTQLLDRVRGEPGTEAATLARSTPLTFVDAGARQVVIDGYATGVGEDLAFLTNVVAPEYFRTLTIGLLAGREFESRDDAAAPPVAIVNETLARRFWSDPSVAIGQRLRVGTDGWRTVIGVARDIKYSRITERPRPYVYLPLLQTYQSSMVLHVRGPAGAATTIDRVRAHLQALDPDLPLLEAKTLGELARATLVFLEVTAAGLFLFGVAGMALAGMGLYGLVSYTVRQSTQEIGVRMALGAQSGGVIWHFLRRGLWLGGIGAAIGGVAALASTRLLGSVLYGVDSTDPASFAGALAVVVGGVLVATIVPAWRAARTDPLRALRHQ